ncbi:AcidPPc domain-containing protein [Fusarium keratoplasticum]|uniref:AcidPPc domain-containing protein n=1 Tax=Fusarium keratoplasticum TaxID=1328300 RepID=A0ACC0RFW5_9HYPO|nr:AcidPPc domain-containing protein [Fusarium keratoplasticum]KAI8683898.1 AcidPPc domain-containing protein [Fusarium keratoplasticum]KAI8688011.1 AcidPPc domain-containing protein [Fusarium keratoplasticum]
MHSYVKMADTGIGNISQSFRGRRLPLRLIFSYLFDWIVCLVFAGIGGVFDRLSPAKRPFSLVDPSISYPFEEHELVPAYLLFTLAIGVPIVIVAVVSLIFVPGPTVPKGTPAALIWQRKLWELHVGLLGLVLSLTLSWFFTSTMKNLFGKPRPDMLARCEPDWDNLKKHIVGGFSWGSMTGQLVDAGICQQKDEYKLNDGFRSYPSGHASTAAGGLIYASLFLASKFSVTVPFVMPSAASAAGATGAASHAAFPSRLVRPEIDPFEPTRGRGFDDGSASTSPTKGSPFADNAGQHNAKVQSLRRQAAAPPVYLLVLGLLPFAVSIFIAGSRWHDRRHHGFDILFGYLMGLIASIFAFRYYHLPIRAGAGWAWGPRSDERAFWAGVGRLGYAGTDEELAMPSRRPTQGVSADTSYPMTSALAQRNVRPRDESADEPRPSQNFQDVELQQMDDRGRPENRFPEPLDNRV